MRIAVVSDIHGNLPALDAVLADIATQGADVTVNLGDLLSGPLWVTETADRLMALGLPTIAGNHERQLLTVPVGRMSASDAHAATRITAAHRAWLASLPPTLRLAGDEVVCCHGTPSSDVDYLLDTVTDNFDPPCNLGLRAATIAEVTARAGVACAASNTHVLLCGHSHIARALRLADGTLVINPGSVGLQAYDDAHPLPHHVASGTPAARYALLSRAAAGWAVDLRSVDYDHAQAALLAERNGRPDWAHALRTGTVGPPEAVSP